MTSNQCILILSHSVGHLTLSFPYWSAFTPLASSCGLHGPCNTCAARTVRGGCIHLLPFHFTVYRYSPIQTGHRFDLISCLPCVCSLSVLQHVVGGRWPAAAGACSGTPTDPQRCQKVGWKHSGEPTAPQSPHWPACAHTLLPPPATTIT